MRGSPLIVGILALCCNATHATAQGARSPQSDPPGTTHGIIRKAQPKTAEPVKVAPAASTEAVAAAIAAAVRSAEEAKKPAPVSRPRAVRPPAAPVPQRRYVVSWSSQRLEVRWDTPDERISLSWGATGSESYAQDDSPVEP